MPHDLIVLAADEQTEIHPAAALFPLMDAEAFAALKADIKANGQREMIALYEGKIIDGRNRFQACYELGIEPDTCELKECESPVSYVMSVNLHRRHLSGSERATIGAELVPALEAEAAKRQRTGKSADGVAGGRGKTLGNSLPKVSADAGKAVEKAAKLVGSNRESIRGACKLKDEAPELFEEVKTRKTTIPKAMRVLEDRKAEPLGYTNGNKLDVPAHLEPIFREQGKFRSLGQKLGNLQTELKELAASPAGTFLSEQLTEALANLTNVQRMVKFSAPHQICPYCKGKGCKRPSDSKSPCRETGWTIKSFGGIGQ